MPDNPRWKRRPPGSTWGDWGPDDQLGRLNLLTPDKVLKGVAEVKEGRTFCLSLPLDYPGGTAVNARRHPPRLLANKRDVPYQSLLKVFLAERVTSETTGNRRSRKALQSTSRARRRTARS